jgi:membrane protease YdiL (CAAX protease family)
MQKKPTYLFLLLVLAVSSIFYVPIVRSGHLTSLTVLGLMWSPATAALITCSLTGRGLRAIAWRLPKGRYIAFGFFVPIAYAAVAYGAVWALGLGGWNSEYLRGITQQRGLPAWTALPFLIAVQIGVGMTFGLFAALGEEIGWRGFLVPELAKQMSFAKLCLLSGIIWAAWHSPLLLFANYNAGTNRWYALACFTLMVVSISFVFAWVRLKSGSVWPAAVLHASHNLFIQGVFDRVMRDTGRTRWYTTEFGIAVALSAAAFALYFWTRRAELTEGSKEHSPLEVVAATSN